MKSSLHIFVAFAFLTGILAPACGFSWGGKYSVVEICTTEGIEQRVVDNGQQPDNNGDPTPTMKDNCAFCFASANVKFFAPENISLEKLQFSAEKIRFNLYETIYLSRASVSGQPRAPPFFA